MVINRSHHPSIHAKPSQYLQQSVYTVFTLGCIGMSLLFVLECLEMFAQEILQFTKPKCDMIIIFFLLPPPNFYQVIQPVTHFLSYCASVLDGGAMETPLDKSIVNLGRG